MTRHGGILIGLVCLLAAPLAGAANLISNGDFETGNVGFVSDHVYYAPPGSQTGGQKLYLPQTYTVDTNPNSWHSAWQSYGDHTTGSGNMMIINAADTGLNDQVTVWQTQVAVQPGIDYEFSYWVALSYAANPPLLETTINGVSVGTYDAVAIGGTANWVKVTHVWNSGSATQATIRIADQRTVYSGDDYTLDDISLEATAQIFDLCAGQTDDVGEVMVWDDGTNLYVQFGTTGAWWMIETHLHVATSAADIPQTKKGNPVPGQFDYQTIHDPRVQTMTYTVPLSGDGPYFVAAHAVVNDQEMILSDTLTLQSDTSVYAYGPLGAYAPVGDAAWSGTGAPAVAAWVHPGWASNVSIPGATWISTAEYAEEAVNNSWRWFHQEFELPYSAFNIAGTVTATADNAEEVYVNGWLIGYDGPVNDTDYRSTYEWRTVLAYDLFYLEPGLNELDFLVRNYAQNGGTPTGNPTGLIYEVNIEYQYDGNEETAWGDGCNGTSFDGNNWGTYFVYVP